MKSSFKLLALGLMLLVPFAAASGQAPSLSAISNVSVNAAAALTVNVVAVDALARPITLTASLPAFATLNAPTTGTGSVITTLTLAPAAANVGTHAASVTATAGGVAATKTFTITVNAAGSNFAPLVVAPALQNVTAGSNLTFTVTASDADAEAITSLGVTGLPTGAMFTPNGTYTSGTFSWTPTAGQAGEYDVIFTASNAVSGSATTHIHVASATTVGPIADVTVAEGATASVAVNVATTAGAAVTLTASLPSFATLNTPTSGTGGVNTTITIAPPAGSAGTYHASVTATSSGVSVTEMFDIFVTGGGENQSPVLTAPATRTVVAGVLLTFDVTATDADGDHVTLSAGSLPTGATFVDNGINTGTFTWTPAVGLTGTFTATFTGNDGQGGTATAATTITVTGSGGGNDAPTLSVPATRTVNEGAALTFTVTASDANGDHVTLTASGVPSGATFSDQGNNTGNFSWTPGSTQAGVYTVTFTGNDGEGGNATATTVITVNDTGGGGGGDADATFRIIGKFKADKDRTCFRITPVNNSFDVRNVNLAGITLVFAGQSIPALGGRTTLVLDCDGDDNDGGDGDDDDGGDGDDDDGDDGDGDDDDGDDDGGGDCDHRHGDAGKLLGGGHPRGDGDDDDDEDCDCPGHDDDGDDDDGDGDQVCDAVGIRACFSTEALLSLFADCALPGDLVDAEIHLALTGGGTVVATFDGRLHGKKDKDKGHGHRVMNPKARPNPFNPKTEISFTLSLGGRVRVSVFDMQGRLVNTLLDEVRTVGEQKLDWDGSNARRERVASGVYFFRIQAPEGEVIQRVAVVK